MLQLHSLSRNWTTQKEKWRKVDRPSFEPWILDKWLRWGTYKNNGWTVGELKKKKSIVFYNIPFFAFDKIKWFCSCFKKKKKKKCDFSQPTQAVTGGIIRDTVCLPSGNWTQDSLFSTCKADMLTAILWNHTVKQGCIVKRKILDKSNF